MAISALLIVGACSIQADVSGSPLGPVTPAPSPGAFGCPTQVLAGSPPTSRLVGVRLTHEEAFDRVAFLFKAGPASKPAIDSGLIVRPVGVIPNEDARGIPFTMEGDKFIEVRFRDMALVDDSGSSSFVGDRDVRAASGAVREVLEIEESSLALDWLIGTAAPGCARVWVDPSGLELYVDVQR
jgi:hypothetical protein